MKDSFKTKFSWVKFFNRKPSSETNKKKRSLKERSSEVFLKLSQGFALPIALLPIGGLIRGIGNILMNTTTNTSSIQYVAGNDIDMLGAIIFSSLPIFFAIAVATTFTNWSGSAAFAATLGYLIFCTFQAPFLTHHFTDENNVIWYSILFYKKVSSGMITQNLGITSLNTSVISGMIIGGIVAKLHNKYKDVRLPNLISFFNGPKLVNIYVYFISMLLSMCFVLLWPLIGLALVYLGNYFSKLPIGMDSWIYGMLERSLIPTGLHNVWNGVFYWTPAGGQLTYDMHIHYGTFSGTLWQYFYDGTAKAWFIPSTYHTPGPGANKWAAFISLFFKNNQISDQNLLTIYGDQNIWFAIYKLGIPFDVMKENGINAGKCLDGRFPFMMFGLMGACLAIVLRSEKSQRRRVAGFMFAAGFTTFLTGTTEPVEYTFVWTAPWLYYFIHVPLDGISWWLMNAFNAHCGLTYSGGLIDYCIYGIVPDILGMHTRSWLVPIIGIPMGVVYFTLFYWAIKRFNAKTPGREGIPMMISPRKIKSINSMLPMIIEDCGGKENIITMLACSTSLRLSVKNAATVKLEKFAELGAISSIQTSPHSFRVLFKEDSTLIADAYNRVYGDKSFEVSEKKLRQRKKIN